jgi:hypothetical protein
MRRILVLLILAAAIGLGLYLWFRTPTVSFDLATRDGSGTLTYTCSAADGEVEAEARATAAHTFFQDQIAAVTEAAAKGMQEAMDAANAAGTTPDFTPIEVVRADLMAATVMVVQDMYGCAASLPPAAE